MLRFLFWNIYRKPLIPLIKDVVRSHNIDVLILAESKLEDSKVLSALNEGQDILFYRDTGHSEAIKLYFRYPRDHFRAVKDEGRIAIRHITSPDDRNNFLLVAVHVPSKLYLDERDQLSYIMDLSDTIMQEEESVKHCRTLLVGDFNMNPFEEGMVNARGLHAIMDRRITARRRFRTVQEKERPLFYNPMWAFGGDISTGPPGTYFFDRSGHQYNLFWNIFDQVLLRPDLLEAFDTDSLEIVTKIGSTSLLDANGRPDKRLASDHLPLAFTLKDLKGDR